MPLLTIILVFLFVIVGWYEDLTVVARSQLDGTIRFRSKQRGHWVEHPDTPGVVIRNVEELAAACHLKERNVPAQLLSGILAKEFKVDKIDWQTQMVVAIDIGGREGNVSLRIRSLRVKGRILILNYFVHYIHQGRKPGGVYLGEMLLVERIDGEMKFRMTSTTSGDPRAK
jgi:hypothetical protein